MGTNESNALNYRSQLHENGMLELVVDGEFTPQLIQQLIRYVGLAAATGPLTGLLLDLRPAAQVSIVRVSGLVEALSDIVRPVAVVFVWNYQHQLASLMHPTLPHRDEIAYFVNPAEAWSYLLRRAQP